LFNCRSLSYRTKKPNYYLFIGVGVVLLAQILFVYLPFMNKVFRSAGLDIESWVISFLVALLILPLMKFIKNEKQA
jgi:Ca2+-transporting ATPase